MRFDSELLLGNDSDLLNDIETSEEESLGDELHRRMNMLLIRKVSVLSTLEMA